MGERSKPVPQGKREIMLLMGMPAPDLATLALRAGMTAVILDTEHGFPFGEEIRSMVHACKAANGKCIVRLAAHGTERIGPLSDVGVDGFILSGIHSLGEVTQAARLAHFPNDGIRSVNPFVPASGTPGDESLLRQSAQQLTLWGMAETAELLDSIDRDNDALERFAADGLGLIIGPYDLAAAIGTNTSFDDQTLQRAVGRIVRAVDAAGVRWGMFVRNAGVLKKWRSLGVNPSMIILGYDRDIWYTACEFGVRDALGGLVKNVY